MRKTGNFAVRISLQRGLWAFVTLLLSVVAATLGGFLAAPKDIPARNTDLA